MAKTNEKTRSIPKLLKKGILLILAVIVIFSCIAFETGERGPYTRWYNLRLKNLAERAELLGKDENAVVASLGNPSNTMRWNSDDGTSNHLTYNYFPYPFIPLSKFQVHFTNGRVANLEMFDD